MFENAGKVLHARTRREEDHDLCWTLFIDEMNQLTEFLIRLTDLHIDKREFQIIRLNTKDSNVPCRSSSTSMECVDPLQNRFVSP